MLNCGVDRRQHGHDHAEPATLRLAIAAFPAARPPRVRNKSRVAVFQTAGLAFAAIVLLVSFATCWGEEVGRIKRAPPTFEEQQRIAAEIAENDGLLRRGDIVVTERGFLVFKGLAADGFTNQFETIPNPLRSSQSKEN